MMEFHYDVAIVGAGPVGGYLALKLREEGRTVLLMEEHGEIGRPFQCAGLVNPDAMSKVSLENTALSVIWGARIHGPSGEPVEIGNPNRIRTWSVCRKKFDESVVRSAIDAGADIWLDSTPVDAEIKDGHALIRVDKNGKQAIVNCQVICGCDGAHSWVRKKFKFGRPKEMMVGFQVEVTGYPGVDGVLDMYTGNSIAPGFFAWAIPSGSTTRVGMWSRPDLLEGASCESLLRKLMNDSIWSERFANCKIVGKFGGPVPSGMLKKTVRPRVALFGDAAGSCKPTTGGGIGPGFEQVDLLVPEISKAIETGNHSEENMARISKILDSMRRKHGKAKALRDAFVTESSDEELDEIFSIWCKEDVIQIINETGEIDNPIPLGIRLLKEVPEFRKVAGKAAKALIWG
ncbi:MAG: geranylgeranyl reductase family protein [Candidatus Thermoplasmatota archaeon]|jgi:geranylgeranyl reductase family protein|nr:geranylgeranyl reductase family protein [Candidatus Thermoplasmatota archaeon]